MLRKFKFFFFSKITKLPVLLNFVNTFYELIDILYNIIRVRLSDGNMFA